jgi:phage baseplate assembly protein gpV
MTNAPPSHDAASEDALAGAFAEVYKKLLQSTDDMLPARVLSYDRAANRVEVQPLIMMLTTTGERVQRQNIAGLPVFQMGGGGFMMGFNLVAGDLGWIKASDRDVSLFLQAYSESQPNTFRLHTFSDALFFPDIMTGYTIAGEDAENLVIQNKAGTVKIALWPNKVKVVAPTVEIVGNTSVTGTLHVTGLVTSDTDVAVNDITLLTHLTSAVTPGVGKSGVPTT